jgi:hypothetical protein
VALEVLITPIVELRVLGRALAALPVDRQSLVALVTPLHEANALAIEFRDGDGRPTTVDMVEYAQHLSRGNRSIGYAYSEGADQTWETWTNGELIHQLSSADALYLPFDDEGFPDMQADPVPARDGVPEGWQLFRTCLDLGMQELHSCRFRPVLWALARADRGEMEGTRALVLSEDGQHLNPPQEVSWPLHYR